MYSWVICRVSVDIKPLNMTNRRELCLQEKVNLIKEKENGLSPRQLSDKFQMSLGSVSIFFKKKIGIHKRLWIESKQTIKTKMTSVLKLTHMFMNGLVYNVPRLFPFQVRYCNNMRAISLYNWTNLLIFVQVMGGFIASAQDTTFNFVRSVEKPVLLIQIQWTTGKIDCIQ